jgi:hypothetical protein
MADDRPVPRQPHRGGSGRPIAAERLLHGRRQRRRVEDRELRPHLDADLRPAGQLHRRDRRPALRSERHLRRQRRRAAAPRPLHRQRHLQVDRSRQELGAPRPARRPAHPRHRGRSARCQPPLRRRPRPPLWSERRARHLPLHRRRSDLPEGSLSRRVHRRRRRGHRPLQSADRVRHALAIAAEAVGGQLVAGRVSGPRQRHFQVHRRRHDLAAAHERPAGEGGGTSARRHRDRPRQHQPALCRLRLDRGDRRHLSVRRRGRVVAAGQQRPAAVAAPERLRPPDPQRSEERRRRLRGQRRRLEVDGRREDVHRLSRRARRGRLPGHLDQPERPEHPLPHRRPGSDRQPRRRRELSTVELLVQPAHRAALQRRHRQCVPVSRVRRPAGERRHVHQQPQRRRAHHVPRLASRGAGGVGERRARSSRS